MDKPYVFVAGPIRTSGILEHNVRDAAQVASALARAGFVPFVPHLNILWNFVDPLPEAHWKEWDRDWLARCDALYRLHGESRGADEEVKEAERLGIPVFADMAALKDWWNSQMRASARLGASGKAGWTKERPTKPGWYWWRHKGVVKPMEVREYVGTMHVCTHPYPMPLGHGNFDETEWSGPIPEPR